MTHNLFLIFSAVWFVILAWRVNRYAGKKSTTIFFGAFSLWLIYVSILAQLGILSSKALPPRLLLILAPIVVFSVWLIRSRIVSSLANQFPLRELVGLQAFRIGVEIFLNQLRKESLVPEAMTFHGHNFDILIGISALVLYLLWNQIPNIKSVSKIWNLVGLAFLANVVMTGILSVPGPLHLLNQEHPNVR